MSTPSHPDHRTSELAAAYDPAFDAAHDNPHAHHGHFIIPAPTLLFVFIALLGFTLLTVGAAKAEVAIAHGFGIIIPQWVNVLVALSIAVVKTALVIGFFMQLRYDNPLNTMVFAFTVVCVLTFFGFTITDLANRSTIDRFKAQYIVPGGTGLDGGGPITKTARDAAILNHKPIDEHGGHGAGAKPVIGSTSNASRPVKGLTLPSLTGAPSADPHAAPADHAGQPKH